MEKARIDPFRDIHDVEAITAHAYPKIFGGSPWNEGYRCPVCKTEFPLSYTETICPLCREKKSWSVLLVECWPRSQVVSDFYREMAKPNALCLAIMKEGKIICFAWGYERTIDQKIDDALEAPGLHQLLSGTYFYLDEVGVLPEYQGKGIGTKMTAWICRAQKQKKILLRTKKDSPMFHIVRKMGGRTILKISKSRVIMILEL